MPNLLIVANCPSKNTRRLHRAVLAGARHPDILGVESRAMEAADAGPDDILWAHGVILGTTENFGYMSGLIKDFLERIYYPCREKTAALPVAVYVKGGLDGSGAQRSVEKILLGLNWKLAQPTLILTGDYRPEFPTQCQALGTTMAAGLEAGIF